MSETNAKNLKEIFHGVYIPSRDASWLEWRKKYLNFTSTIAKLNKNEFFANKTQEMLWDDNPISSVGPGSAVTVEGAYSDKEIAGLLWTLKNLELPESTVERAATLQEFFDQLVEEVTRKHSASKKKPTARLVRAFAALRPFDAMCIVSFPWLKTLHKALGKKIGLYNKGIIATQVRTLDALFHELELERNLENAVDINQFSWWLAARQQQEQNTEPGASLPPSEYTTATDRPSLSILTPAAQRKGLFYVTDNISILRLVAEASSDGATRDELRDLILGSSPNLKASSADNIMSQAKALGLLRLENNAYFLTSLGEELRDGELPHQVLFPIMVRRIFGFAQILAFVRDSGWRIRKTKLLEQMRSIYPSWTTDFMPSQLTTWMVRLGLFAYEGKNSNLEVVATDDGRYWASGLPENIPLSIIKSEESDGDKLQEEIIELLSLSFKAPKFEDVLAHYNRNNLIIPRGLLLRLHSALHALDTKRFVLLAGLSGTGKTSIARAYADAYCKALGLPAEKHYCEIAVWPDWTDPTSLLGFVNPLHGDPTYQTTEALNFLRAASRTPDKPFFLCLDEMNLARVEHYFAPFLSAMEGKAGSQVLKLHAFDDAIDTIEPKISWPRNLFIFGTVNMDETTHPFSDRVLDRAFPFELWEVDKAAWLDSKIKAGGDEEEKAKRVFPILSSLYDALLPVRLHFGYRTFDEILKFCVAWPGYFEFTEIMDAAVYAKILPKLRGENTEAFSAALTAAEKICADNDMKQCEKRLKAMRDDLAAVGFAKFWS